MFTQLAHQFNTNPQLDDDQGYEEVPTVKCPFDSSHMMQPKNYLTHIYRCGSPNKSLYVQCKYDPCHWIYPQERQKHHQYCQTRIQHYKDMDIQEGDWDQQQMQRRIEQKLKKQKRQKMKQKLRKLYNYLKQKKIQEKRIKQQMKNNPSTQISRHTQRTRQLSQYEVDKFSSFSEIKKKLKNFINKKGLQKSMAKSQQIHLAKQNINIQPPKSCYDGTIKKINNLPTNIQLPPKQFALQPFQLQLQPINQFPQIPPSINGFRPQYPPNIQQYPPVPLHILQNQSFPVNYMPPNPYPLNYLSQPYNPFMPQLTPPIPQLYYANGVPYQQPWQYQTTISSFRQKPKPETSLQFDVDASTQDFIKKAITEGEQSQKSNQTIKISSQVQDTPYVPEEMYLNYPDYTNYYVNYRQCQYNMDIKPKKRYVQKEKNSQFVKQSEKTNKTKDNKQKYLNEEVKKQNSQNQSKQNKKKKKQQKQARQQKKQRQRKQKQRSQKKQKQQKRQRQKRQKQQKKNEKKQKKQSKKKQFNKDYSLICSNTKTSQFKEKHNKQNKKKDIENKSKHTDKSQDKKKSKQKQQINKTEKIKTKQTALQINYQQQYQDPARFQPYMYQHTFPHNMQTLIHPPIQSTFTKKQQIPQFTPVLDNSISAYDFQPFQHSMNMTIKNQLFRFHDKSQFLQMKQMLSILDKGDTSNSKKQSQGGYSNENKKVVYKQKRDFGYNNFNNKR